jgi:hypothetical protein
MLSRMLQRCIRLICRSHEWNILLTFVVGCFLIWWPGIPAPDGPYDPGSATANATKPTRRTERQRMMMCYKDNGGEDAVAERDVVGVNEGKWLVPRLPFVHAGRRKQTKPSCQIKYIGTSDRSLVDFLH